MRNVVCYTPYGEDYDRLARIWERHWGCLLCKAEFYVVLSDFYWSLPEGDTIVTLTLPCPCCGKTHVSANDTNFEELFAVPNETRSVRIEGSYRDAVAYCFPNNRLY